MQEQQPLVIRRWRVFAIGAASVGLLVLLRFAVEPPTASTEISSNPVAASPQASQAFEVTPRKSLHEHRPAAISADVVPPRPPIPLSPFAQGLGAKAEEVLGGGQAGQALQLARLLARCTDLLQRQQVLERLNSHLGTSADGRALQEELRLQLDRDRAECQTVAGDPMQKRAQLLALAYRGGQLGAAAEMLSTGQVPLPEGVLDRVAADARNGEIGSLVRAMLEPRVALGDQERQAMLFALQRTYRSPGLRAVMEAPMNEVVLHHWKLRETAPPDGKQPLMGYERDEQGYLLLPPELQEPGDAAMQEQIAALERVLRQHAEQLAAERRDAERRAGRR